MVAAISTTPRIPKTPSSSSSSSSTSTTHRPPLSPSHKTSINNNNAEEVPRKPINNNIPSRYLHSPSAPPSPSSSSSSSSSTQSPRPISSMSSISSTTTTRSLSVSFQGHSFSFQTTKPKPVSQNPPKKSKNASSNPLASKTGNPNSLMRSPDCLIEKKGSILLVIDEKDLYLNSESNSSNSLKGRAQTRGISVPARFWPENFSPAMKSRSSSSSIKRLNNTNLKGQQGNVPYSILSFGAAEARRVKNGESRIEEAHSLRMLYNRYLQWRCVNAHADAAILVQTVNTEKNLFDAWLTTSQLRDSVANKQIKLQILLQKLRLASILKEQMVYLEEWSLMDSKHYKYLSGLIEALKASTFRLPVVSGAMVDIQEMQNAVNSAVDVMQAMGTSICSLLPKVEGTSSLVSELAKAAAHEQALLNQSKDLLSTVASMHVKQCSLRGHILQLNHNLNLMKL